MLTSIYIDKKRIHVRSVKKAVTSFWTWRMRWY